MRISRDIYLKGHHWRMVFENDTLSFYYITIVTPEITEMDRGFSNFDGNDVGIDPYEHYEWMKILNIKGVSPIAVTNLIIKNAVSMVKGRDFFYFVASSKERTQLYTRLADTLAEKLGPKWSYQIVEGHFFYNKG